MIRKPKGILLIGVGLSLIYGLSLLTHLYYVLFLPAHNHGLVLSVIFGVLFAGGLGVIQCREWGRRVVVFGNVVLGGYCLLLLLNPIGFNEPAYLFTSILMVLFFTQAKIKFQFTQDLQYLRKSVLVVDDDEGSLRAFQQILLKNGFSALSAMTGERGLQVAKLQKPDLIILDVILPGIKGREVCARLKEDPETRDIPVIFATAKDSPDDVEAERKVGGVAHLTKPINARDLLVAIRKHVK